MATRDITLDAFDQARTVRRRLQSESLRVTFASLNAAVREGRLVVARQSQPAPRVEGSVQLRGPGDVRISRRASSVG